MKITNLCIIMSSVIGSSAFANVVGSDTQNFNSTTSGIDFVTVHSSKTLGQGLFNLGLMLNHAVNSLPVLEEGEQVQSRTTFNDTLLTADALVGFGVMEDFEIGLAISRLVNQNIEDTEVSRGEFSKPGVTGYRLGLKYRLYDEDDIGVAGIYTATFNNVKNNPYLGDDSTVIHNLEMAVDYRMLDLVMALNLGYRFRDQYEALDDSPIEPTPNQWIGSAALSYLLSGIDTKLIVETFGSRPVGQERSANNSARQASSLEGIAGLKYDYTTNLAMHFGGGTEFTHGFSSPDWRLYAGVNWTIGSEYEERPPLRESFVLPPPVGELKITAYRIEFEFDSANIKMSSKETLKELAEYLSLPPVFKRLIVEGHTDSVGSQVYNQSLSEKRARSVREYLVKQAGLDGKKIEAVGFGESKPVASNANFQGRKQNRRVDLRIFR